MIPSLSVGTWVSRGVDVNGSRWKMNTLTGWDEPPPGKGEFTDRPNGNGSFDTQVYDDARVLTWTGQVVSPDRDRKAIAKLDLSRLARALRGGADIVGHMDGGDLTVHAKRSSSWSVASFGPLGFRYQAVVTCPDPYKYGAAFTDFTAMPSPGASGLSFPLFGSTGVLEFGAPGNSGQLTLTNTGTTEASAVFTLTGGLLGGFDLTELASSRVIRYIGDVAATDTLVIDTGTGHAELNGSVQDNNLPIRQWTPVQPESSLTFQISPLGASGQAAILTGSLEPAYL